MLRRSGLELQQARSLPAWQARTVLMDTVPAIMDTARVMDPMPIMAGLVPTIGTGAIIVIGTTVTGDANVSPGQRPGLFICRFRYRFIVVV